MNQQKSNPQAIIAAYRDVFTEHRIELVELMGTGGEAPVFRGRRTLGDGRTVLDYAVKIYEFRAEQPEIPPEIRTQLAAMSRLQNEPHIVQLHEIIHHPKFVALVLELGIESLQDVLQKEGSGGGLDRTICLDWFEPIARALDTIHSANLYHGDVKPSNILRCKSRQIKLCDFGSVIVADSLTTVLQPFATAAFLLPGHNKRPPRDRDLFAFAASYAYARLGRLPFGDEDPSRGELDLTGLDPDERDVLLPILKRDIPSGSCESQFSRLRPFPILPAESFAVRVKLLVDRVDSRRWRDGYQPDQRDIEDVRHAKQILEEHAPSGAESSYYQGLRSRVLATLADLLASAGKNHSEARKLFSEAFKVINTAITLAPDCAEHLAYRADLRLIAQFGGTHNLPLMFVLGKQVFDAPNSPWSSDVAIWDANRIAESLADITQAVALNPTPDNLARRALLLVLRGIMIYRKNGDFPGADKLNIWHIYREPFAELLGELGGDVYELAETAIEILFSEPITELNRAIELSQSPLMSANLLIQRAWTRAGFDRGLCEPEGFWSLTESVADLGRSRQMVTDYHPVFEDDDDTFTNDERFANELENVIRRRLRSYSLWLAFPMEVGAVDLLGMLDVTSFKFTFHEKDQATLLYLLDHFAFGSTGFTSPYSRVIKNFLAEPERKHLVAPDKLSKFFYCVDSLRSDHPDLARANRFCR